MRPTSRRMRKHTLSLYRRVESTAGRGGGDYEDEPAATLPCTAQPLGDTGRRQDTYDEQHAARAIDSWRVFVSQSDVEAAGLEMPWGETLDRIVWRGRPYALRGEPIPQRFDGAGAALEWSLDIDGVD